MQSKQSCNKSFLHEGYNFSGLVELLSKSLYSSTTPHITSLKITIEFNQHLSKTDHITFVMVAFNAELSVPNKLVTNYMRPLYV